MLGHDPGGCALPRPLTDIPNIGPATAEAFARAGLDDAEALRAIGARAAYALWLRAGNAPHFIGYYALVMGLQGRPWNDCRGPEKDRLRAEFDALKAEIAASGDAAPSGIESILNEIGLIRPRR